MEVADYRNGTLPVTSYKPANMLRPEVVESFFYLWRATKNPEYRDWGWQVFQAFQKHSRTPEGAYSSIQVLSSCQLAMSSHYDAVLTGNGLCWV